MRVLHLVNGLGTGGAERSLQEMFPRFREMGIQSEAAVFYRRPEGVEAQVMREGTPLHEVGGNWGQRIRGVRQLIRQRQPAVIHTSLFDADLVGRVAAAGTGVPVVTSLVSMPYDPSREHDPRVSRRKLRLVRRLDQLTGRHLTRAFHAITPPVKHAAVRDLRLKADRVTVIPRGRDSKRLGRRTPERRERARRELGLTPGQPVIVNVGRREFAKGHDTLLDALVQVRESHANVQLLVAGREGNTSDDLYAQVERLGLTPHVQWLGHTDKVSDLLCAGDVFAFPSRYEGLGGALIEALALEIPIVASDIPALRYVLDDGGAGVMIRPDDSAELATQLDIQLRGGAAVTQRIESGRQRFEAVFQLESVTARMADWLRESAR